MTRHLAIPPDLDPPKARRSGNNGFRFGQRRLERGFLAWQNLQERMFERVGNHKPIHCNVRIIAATHRHLEEAIQHGGFRQDLFYRLNVFPIELPALRERLADLPALIEEFVAVNVREGRARIVFTEGALAALKRYPWPGNVRELANLVERLSILQGGRAVDACDLPARYRPGVADPAPTPMPVTLPDAEVLRLLEGSAAEARVSALPADGIDLRQHLDAIERSLVEQALERSGGTVAHAARLLGLRRTTLVEKLRKFGEPAGERGGVLTGPGVCRASL